MLNSIQSSSSLSEEEKSGLMDSINKVNKHLEIVSFKLERTEKIKRTTAILLEETIEELEKKRKAVEETNTALKKSMDELKAAQAQLIHSEKMASLGELTAGIAHEIQNPLNFVNNFSEVSADMIEELNEELQKGDTEEVIAIAKDLLVNLEKINHHGKRASGIVRGMLEHSRTGSGEKVSTDINELADEYLRLAYHGLRAKDKSFNADFRLEADENLPELYVVPQDIGRVLLNLINNAFYACTERSRSAVSAKSSATADANYNPEVVVTTHLLKPPLGGLGVDGGLGVKGALGVDGGLGVIGGSEVMISVKDNGDGIPEDIKEKIFQPFFTTKPTGEGTGLGLSMSYDIVTKGHGGSMTVETKAGEGSSFRISIPLSTSK